jgi:hypothetical protein
MNNKLYNAWNYFLLYCSKIPSIYSDVFSELFDSSRNFVMGFLNIVWLSIQLILIPTVPIIRLILDWKNIRTDIKRTENKEE